MVHRPAAPLPFDSTLGYATNGLDRLSAQRNDPAFLEAARLDADARTLVLVGERVVLNGAGVWFTPKQAEAFGPLAQEALLGRDGGGGTRWARGLPADALAEDHPDLADLRGLATGGRLAPADLGALAQAKALFHWHRTHRFCAACGAASRPDQAGWRRICGSCGALHFPRTDPVVIMMASQGDSCLLGRQPRFPPGMYSCLAGFVEPGETVEDAVRRELAEESGIVAGTVRYLGSQPWPFPASLMIGCLAQAETTAITIDEAELEDARWFSRAETLSMLEGRHPGGLACPAPMAIAHHLMRAWAEGAEPV